MVFSESPIVPANDTSARSGRPSATFYSSVETDYRVILIIWKRRIRSKETTMVKESMDFDPLL